MLTSCHLVPENMHKKSDISISINVIRNRVGKYFLSRKLEKKSVFATKEEKREQQMSTAIITVFVTH